MKGQEMKDIRHMKSDIMIKNGGVGRRMHG
jgi:hypothetical protein